MTVDLEVALRAARVAVAALQPFPPTWLTDHLARLEWLGCASATDAAVAQSDWNMIGTAEAARVLGCSQAYVRRIAATLDGHRIADCWIFDRRKVEDYAVHRRTA